MLAGVPLDGVSEKELSLESIREQIVLVPQDPFLFFGTIAENLRIANEDATDAELVGALKAAELYAFVASSPDGLDTKVGDQGMALSGGQTQRLPIARAFLKNAPIIVLDEATSSLDVQTEQSVMQALQRLCEGRTTLTIAHRLSTIVNADEILVMIDGRIAERGTHAELMSRGGWYARMFELQQDEADATLVAGT